MERTEALKRVVGLADACELLSCAFAFPDERLAEGLCGGALADDAEACLRDAGASDDAARPTVEGLRAWRGAEADRLLARMRTTYSQLYLAPGGSTPIFPYESAFIHVERGLPGAPALFRTAVTLDVERQMHEAGVAAKNERKEPCDSVFEEFEFLSYLFAKKADALVREFDHEAAGYEERARAFERDHALAWLPSFMERTRELAAGEPYEVLAALGAVVLATMEVRP